MSSKQKFYAVRNGKKTGIFTTWDECKSYVTGFSGAIYKSFPTQKQAEEYMNEFKKTNSIDETKQNFLKSEILEIYTDGSFKDNKCGCAIYYKDKKIVYYSNLPQYNTNNQAELAAIILALEIYEEKEIKIYTDSQYLKNQLEGSHSTNANKEMINEIKELSKNRQIVYEYVPAHIGIQENEIVDKYAKKATEIHQPNSMIFSLKL